MESADTEDRACAFVQGASRGIGLALTKALLENRPSARIVATSRRPDQAPGLRELEAAWPERLTVIALDVTDEATIAGAAKRLEREGVFVSLLVNCSGLLHDGDMQPEKRLADVEPGNLSRAFDVNAIGPLLVVKHFERFFPRTRRTVVANLSARVGSIEDNGLGGWYGYRASKAAQNMFTRTLAIELRRKYRKLLCVALHPGTVDTNLSAPFRRNVRDGGLFTPDQAARRLLTVIDGLGESDNGRFFAWDGTSIPW